LNHLCFLSHRFEVIRQTALAAEPLKWSPPEGSKWDEKDYEVELKKLENEAEERLDKKIDELMKKIDTTGAK
jgi:RecB family endonuclease NucS